MRTPRKSSRGASRSASGSQPGTPTVRWIEPESEIEATPFGHVAFDRTGELADRIESVDRSLGTLQRIHQSLTNFNESVGSFLYGLDINAWCVHAEGGEDDLSKVNAQIAEVRGWIKQMRLKREEIEEEAKEKEKRRAMAMARARAASPGLMAPPLLPPLNKRQTTCKISLAPHSSGSSMDDTVDEQYTRPTKALKKDWSRRARQSKRGKLTRTGWEVKGRKPFR